MADRMICYRGWASRDRNRPVAAPAQPDESRIGRAGLKHEQWLRGKPCDKPLLVDD